MPYIHAITPIKPPARAMIKADARTPWDSEVKIKVSERPVHDGYQRPVISIAEQIRG